MKNPFLSIFKKPIDSVSNEITSKFKTPIITTYIIVWVLRNKLFIYDLFFSTSIKTTKRELLEVNLDLSSWNFYKEILLTFFISLLILTVYYFFLNISRSLTILSEERFKLNLLNSLESKKVRSVDDINLLKNEKLELEKTNKELSEIISSNKFKINNQERDIESISKNYKTFFNDVDSAFLRIRKDKLFDNNIDELEDVKELLNNEHSRILKEKDKVPSFLSV